MSDQRVVLITGASSGVGQATARLLSQRHYKVFGTSRNPASAEIIPAVEMLPLDVRADDSVRACVEAVSTRGGRIDVLINNAGYELAGALEELTSEEAKAQFETNFFGVVSMVNAVLPFMRQQKRGHIINVGSLSGLSPIPFLGIYSASKFALEGYTETLRHEVKPFNIHVSLTEAGFLKTPMMNHRQVGANRIPESWPAAGGRDVARDCLQQYSAATVPDRATGEIRRPTAAISPGRNVFAGSAAYLLAGQDPMRRLFRGQPFNVELLAWLSTNGALIRQHRIYQVDRSRSRRQFTDC
jgi:short-subunit dehydrogenase